MFDQQDEIKNKKGPLSVLNLTGASQFFYQKSNFITAILATVIFIGYLLLVMTDKARSWIASSLGDNISKA